MEQHLGSRERDVCYFPTTGAWVEEDNMVREGMLDTEWSGRSQAQ